MRVLFVLKEPLMHDRMGVMYLSAALKAEGHEVRLAFGANGRGEHLYDCMREYVPQVVGYSAMTGEHQGLLEINRRLKRDFEFHAVFGGPHATFFPDLILEDGCDALCIGEGDVALPEFCRRLESGDHFWETPSFVVKRDGQIYRSPLLPRIKDLDRLPFPDRELMYQADPAMRIEGRKSFMATRGCPYQCTYCFNHKYNKIFRGLGPVMRHRSPENLIDEIVEVRDRYALDWVALLDDTFMIRPQEWLDRFCSLYKAKVHIPFGCCARADLVTDRLIAQLKDAGLDMCGMGIECADENVANEILKRNLTNEQIVNAATILRRHRVKLMTFNLLGLPVENPYAIDLKTLDLNIRIRPTFAWSSILYPYPGTGVGEYARKQGYCSENAPFLETNKRSSMLNFGSDMEKRKVENLHKLFGLIVRFPILRRFADRLCRLPQNRFYLSLFYLWYGYCFKVKLWPYRSFWREIGNYRRLFFGLIRKS